MHDAVVSVPAVPEDVPETVKPRLHSGRHIASLANVVVQILMTPNRALLMRRNDWPCTSRW